MRKNAILSIMLAAVLMLFLTVCTSDTADSDNQETDTLLSDVDAGDGTFDSKTSYRIPSPVKLFIHIKKSEARFNKDALNPVENLDKYVTTDHKAVNFGVYAADLAYSTVFQESQKSMQYFKNVKLLAEGLGLSEGFNEIMADRIDSNEHNPDSIYEIANDAYYDACNYLEAQDKIDLLSYILIGGWIESSYLTINSVTKFSATNPIVGRIVEQRFVLDNLLLHLQSLQNKDEQMKTYVNKLVDIQDSFNVLYENSKDVAITESQFKEISLKISNFRKEIIS